MTPETVPELALVRPAALTRSRVRPEAREAVLEIYSEHYSSLVRLAHLMAHDPSQAEDIVHEAFLKLYGAWKRIEHPEKALPYLRATVANGARGRARRHLIALRHRPAAPANAAAAEDGALVRESRRAVVDALRELPSRQRQCLVLRHYEDLSESEIASTLGISVGSVRTHVKRGYRVLQRKLGEFR